MNKSVYYSLLSVLPLVGCNQAADKADQKYNVLFIMADDLNDYQGIFGGHPDARTPNIDRLAAMGTQFVNAQTNCPLSQPSRNSLFTGVYPHSSRDFGWTPHFDNELLKDSKTFIEVFHENGYKTIGSGKLLHADVPSLWDDWGEPRGINYGPSVSNGKELTGHPSVPKVFREVNIVDGSFSSLANTPIFVNEKGDSVKGKWVLGKNEFRYVNDDDRDLMPDERHVKWAVKKLKEMEESGQKENFFMGIGLVKPHTPLYAPQKYFDMFPLDKIRLPKIKENDMEDCHYKSVYPDSEMGIHYFQALKEAYGGTDEGLRKFLQGYLACIAFMDDQVGVLLDALENSKFKDNTIVVFVSDHGWQMGEKDYLYKNSPWEESARIPMLIYHPDMSKPGSKVKHPVSLIDMYPTLVDLCGLDFKPKTPQALTPEGHSMKGFIQNPELKTWDGPNGALTVTGVGINKPIEGLAVCSNPKALWHIKVLKPLGEEYVAKQNYSYRTERWRYIMYHNGKEELYDHDADPYEWNNLADDPNCQEVKKQLHEEVVKLLYH